MKNTTCIVSANEHFQTRSEKMLAGKHQCLAQIDAEIAIQMIERKKPHVIVFDCDSNSLNCAEFLHELTLANINYTPKCLLWSEQEDNAFVQLSQQLYPCTLLNKDSFSSYNNYQKSVDATPAFKTEHLIDRNHVIQHDSVTKLINHRCFHKELIKLLQTSLRHERKFALMLIDISEVADKDDKSLRRLAKMLGKAIRNTDLPSYLGDNRFAILFPDIKEKNDIDILLSKILIKTCDYPITVGLSSFPDDGQCTTTMLRTAQTRLADSRGDLQNDLRQAVVNQEFLVFYQPIVHLASHKMLGVEALVRWDHPKLGLLKPVDFLAQAEAIDLLPAIEIQVIQEACKQVYDWQLNTTSSLQLCINLSAQQLTQPDFKKTLLELIDNNSTPYKNIHFEVSELTQLTDPELFQKNVADIVASGIKISIDDFGCGYSSLAFLRSCQATTLKIDNGYFSDLNDDNSLVITYGTIKLAHALGMNVLAKGVETAAQAQFLKQLGCSKAQGYYFCSPLTADELTNLLHEELKRSA